MSDEGRLGLKAARRRASGGIGERASRPDGRAKVTGEFAYSSDLWLDGMLWGATLRSPHPSARITGIDITRALRTPGVHAVLTAADVPGRPTYGLEIPDQPVLAIDRVRFQGEPVALVAATHPEIARQAAKEIQVGYEVTEALTDPHRALDEQAPRLHGTGNLLREVKIVRGQIPPADVVVTGDYHVGMQDQAFLGPESGLAVPAEDGGVDLFVATQWLHVDRAQLAQSLKLPEDKVRITLSGVGGAFGAREDLSMQIHACLLALHTGKPVKIVYGRAESFFGHVHRHPAWMHYEHGATKDGRLVYVKADILLDGGAYASSSPAVAANAATLGIGPYEVPNVVMTSRVVYTNSPPCGAMRGFGAVQACFGYESQMDKLARALGMHPADIRLKNAMREGSVMPTGQTVDSAAPVAELITLVRDRPLPDDADGTQLRPGGYANTTHGEGVRRGVGYAVSIKNVCYSEGFDDYSTARVRLDHGGATVHTAAAEVGQGLVTVLAQIARTELGVENVVVLPADTSVGSAGSSSASRQTYMTGGAVREACRQVLAMGTIPAEVTAEFRHRPTSPLDPDTGQGDAHVQYAFAAHRAVVDVDTELGLIKVVEIATAQDVGKAMNPQAVEGQIHGGIAQGIGLAVMEEIQVSGGAIRNPSFTDYLIPTILDMPPVQLDILELADPHAPYGLRGVGEPPTISSTPAVVAAIRAATGTDLSRVPVRPSDIALAPEGGLS